MVDFKFVEVVKPTNLCFIEYRLNWLTEMPSGYFTVAQLQSFIALEAIDLAYLLEVMRFDLSRLRANWLEVG